jgi:hypothetical protein
MFHMKVVGYMQVGKISLGRLMGCWMYDEGSVFTDVFHLKCSLWSTGNDCWDNCLKLCQGFSRKCGDWLIINGSGSGKRTCIKLKSLVNPRLQSTSHQCNLDFESLRNLDSISYSFSNEYCGPQKVTSFSKVIVSL